MENFMIYIGILIGIALGAVSHWLYTKYAVVKIGAREKVVIDVEVNSEEALKQIDLISKKADDVAKKLGKI